MSTQEPAVAADPAIDPIIDQTSPGVEAVRAAVGAVLNEICLVHDTDLARIIGIGLDDDDVYYVGQVLRPSPNGERIVQFSAVGACESLKGKIDRYAALERVFTLNGCAPTDRMVVIDERSREAANP